MKKLYISPVHCKKTGRLLSLAVQNRCGIIEHWPADASGREIEEWYKEHDDYSDYTMEWGQAIFA